ncbi:hypothetical protein [uncultured Propionivibrio sp.]|uniref:hypothetical protein n=1 Tax=uncultured Propionivibrio sp. TaxID=426737 RepID=UPI0029C09156|nr:hypothetical protein [uncultured Propionivibrio sp.]
MTLRTVAISAALLMSLAQAGEIIIQPGGTQTRTEKEASRSAASARSRVDGRKAPVVIEDGSVDSGSQAQRLSQDAQEYMRSGGAPASDEKTTIILRNAPQSDADKSRQRAAAYVPGSNAANSRACGDVSITVGAIGDKTVVDRNISVNERGNSAVNVNCKK